MAGQWRTPGPNTPSLGTGPVPTVARPVAPGRPRGAMSLPLWGMPTMPDPVGADAPLPSGGSYQTWILCDPAAAEGLCEFLRRQGVPCRPGGPDGRGRTLIELGDLDAARTRQLHAALAERPSADAPPPPRPPAVDPAGRASDRWIW